MINFRVLTTVDIEHANKVIFDLHARGFKTTDILSADILQDEDDAKVGECYAICCQGSAWNYFQLRNELIQKYGLREFKWEGFRTLG